jgi:hypothetical protein
MPRRLVALALLALSLPQLALAEQARIALFEAVARAEPRPDATPLETFVEGTPVSVSEEAQAGWRRIRLRDGGIGWIEERALRLGDAPPPALVAPLVPPPVPAPPPPAPDLRSHIYVKDLDHLSELVKGDPVVGPEAAKLAERRTTAWVVGGLGVATSIGVFVYGGSQFGKHSDVNDPRFGDQGNGPAAMAIGAVVLAATVLVAGVVAPKRGDLLDVMNAWNVRHPEQQFTIGEHAIER